MARLGFKTYENINSAKVDSLMSKYRGIKNRIASTSEEAIQDD